MHMHGAPDAPALQLCLGTPSRSAEVLRHEFNSAYRTLVLVSRDTTTIDRVDLNQYKLLYIPSNNVNTPGGITSTLNRALIRNKAKITNFVNVRGELCCAMHGRPLT